MIDLHNPSPLVMTTFEKISTITALGSVAVAVLLDLWKGYSGNKTVPLGNRHDDSPE